MSRVTPESKVKKKVRRVLDEFGAYYFMPVQTGFGAAGLDFHCHISWRGTALAFYIETKAEAGMRPSDRQANLIIRLREDGAKVFLIGSDAGVDALRKWLTDVRASSKRISSPAARSGSDEPVSRG